MKILYVITRSERGGAQAVVLTYLQALGTHADLALATGEEGFLADQARVLGVPVFIFPDLIVPIEPRRDCRALRSLYKLIRTYQPDLVHAHSSKAGLLGRLAARLAGVPSVFTAHGFAFTENAGLLRKIVAIPSEWLGAKLGQSVIAVSEYDRELALRCRVLAASDVNVIHNGISAVGFRARPEAGSTVNMVMVARFAPPKDHECALRAVAELRSDWKLWFIGDGPRMSRVQAEVIRLGLRDRVVFMGARDDVPALLAKAHIFVLASKYEGLPITILEAMRAGLPVVASDVGGVRECVRDGSTGFLVGRGDHHLLQDRLRQLLSSPSRRTQMGDAGRKLFEEQFSATAMIQQTLAIYQRLIARRSAVPVNQSHAVTHSLVTGDVSPTRQLRITK